MNKKDKYYENLAAMNIPSLESLANNGVIYMIQTKEQLTDLLTACRIEGINPKGYQLPDIQKTKLPVFFAVATFEYHTFFLLHSHEFSKVHTEMHTVLSNAINNIKKLDVRKCHMEIMLLNLPKNDTAYTFPGNKIGYSHIEEAPQIIPYPQDIDLY